MEGPQAIYEKINPKKSSKTYRKAFKVSTNFCIKYWRHDEFPVFSCCQQLLINRFTDLGFVLGSSRLILLSAQRYLDIALALIEFC